MLILSVSDMAGALSTAAPSAARPFFNRLSDASVFLTCQHQHHRAGSMVLQLSMPVKGGTETSPNLTHILRRRP